MKTIDINSEVNRTYHYETGSFTIENPVSVTIIEDDKGVTHRVVARDGRTYRPERGWVGISWQPGKDQPAFVA